MERGQRHFLAQCSSAAGAVLVFERNGNPASHVLMEWLLEEMSPSQRKVRVCMLPSGGRSARGSRGTPPVPRATVPAALRCSPLLCSASTPVWKCRPATYSCHLMILNRHHQLCRVSVLLVEEPHFHQTLTSELMRCFSLAFFKIGKRSL